MEVDPRWLDDAKTLKIVRGQREYVRDPTVVAKIVALFERIAELVEERDNAIRALMLDQQEARREGARKALEYARREPRWDTWIRRGGWEAVVAAALDGEPW